MRTGNEDSTQLHARTQSARVHACALQGRAACSQQDLDDTEGLVELVEGALGIAEGLGRLARCHVELVVVWLHLLQLHEALIRVPDPSCRFAVAQRVNRYGRPADAQCALDTHARCAAQRAALACAQGRRRAAKCRHRQFDAAPALKSARALLPRAWKPVSIALLDFFAHVVPDSSVSTHSPASHPG